MSKRFNYSLPIHTSEGYFVMYPPQTSDRRFELTRTVTVPNDSSRLAVSGSVGAALLPVLGLIVLLHGRVNDWFDAEAALQNGHDLGQFRFGEHRNSGEDAETKTA